MKKMLYKSFNLNVLVFLSFFKISSASDIFEYFVWRNGLRKVIGI